MRRFAKYTLTGLLAIAPLTLAADGRDAEPPRRLVEIVRQQLEKAGFGPIHEVSRDHGNWEVEVMKGKDSYELTVDAATGEVLSQHRDDPERQPPKDALTLSELLEKLAQDSGYDQIDEISFERRYWEIEVIKERETHELHVDPRTAKIMSDRIDD